MSTAPVTRVKLIAATRLRTIRRTISNAIMMPEAKKNGILILVMNGCTTSEASVIISCQYSVNSMYDESTSGNDSSANVAAAHSGYSPKAWSPSMA